MMMQNMMMNQIMINQMNNGMMMPNNMNMNQMGNYNMMINQENNNIINQNINNENKLEIYFGQDEYIDSISKNILSENDVYRIGNKLISIYSNLKKKLYREPYPKEVILRESPKETLEYLLNRGVIEDCPNIEIFIKSYGWKDMYFLKWNNLTFKEVSKVSFGVPIRGAGGFAGLEFVNLGKDSNAKVLKFSNNAPKWRKVCEGLNLFGKCIYSKCQAFKKEVIYQVGINIKFDFNEQQKEILCPICKKNFIPKTLGFWKCEYQIKGEKLKDGDYIKVDINGRETKGDDFEYFDADENGTVNWNKLSVFACYRQKMKYKA
jgi:hypothetical protein